MSILGLAHARSGPSTSTTERRSRRTVVPRLVRGPRQAVVVRSIVRFCRSPSQTRFHPRPTRNQRSHRRGWNKHQGGEHQRQWQCRAGRRSRQGHHPCRCRGVSSFLLTRPFSDTRQAIFRRCGPIIASELVTNQASESVVVRLTFKQTAHAAAAVAKFDKQPADGRILHVTIVGVQSVGLSGRLGGVELVNEDGSVDVLMAADDNAGS